MDTNQERPLISYAHQADPHGTRYQQFASDTIPVWAVDIKPHKEDKVTDKQTVTMSKEAYDSMLDVIESGFAFVNIYFNPIINGEDKYDRAVLLSQRLTDFKRLQIQTTFTITK